MGHQNNYKVYILIFPNQEIYIGQTFQDLKNRWDCGYGYRKGSRVRNAIDYYGWENVTRYSLYENLTKEEADRLELLEIKHYGGLNNPKILNEQSGGTKGFKNSEYTKQKVSNGLNRFYKEHPEVLTQVDQYSYDNGSFIATYESVAQASKYTGIDSGHISACLNFNRLSAGGYRWVKHNKRLAIIQYPMSGIKNPVCQLDKNTKEIIHIYDSIASASKITKISVSGISSCIKEKLESAGGFKWKYCTFI